MQPSTIVVGTDGSIGAELAVIAARDLAEAFDGEVHVVNAHRPPSAAEVDDIKTTLPSEFRSTYDAYHRSDAVLDAAAQLIDLDGIKVHRHSVSGDAASAILDIADEVSADLIVVGSRGLGRTMRFLRGSVSTKVMTHSKKNVLVIHDE